MVDTKEIEIEEKSSDGVKLHSLKLLVVGYVREAETSIINNNKNQCVMFAFNDICQVCYLFYFGIYPNIYLLNGSGEDGDEYHCNGLLLINLTDGRFNYLNIYDINNDKRLMTLNEDWDKQHCGVCVVKNIYLPKLLLKNIPNKHLLKQNINIKYNIVFRVGGACIDTLESNYTFNIFIFDSQSQSLTKIDSQIYNTLLQLNHDKSDLIIDAINGYQIELPDLSPYIDELDDKLVCVSTFSKTYGLIVVFKSNKKVFQFDWFDSFKWKQLPDMQHDHSERNSPSICLLHDSTGNGNECIFVYGENNIHTYMDQYTYTDTDTELYSFKDNKWIDLAVRLSDVEHNVPPAGGCSLCYDSKRQRIYVSSFNYVDCYDIIQNKWMDIFPPHNITYGDNTNIGSFIFIDKLGGNYLYLGGVDGEMMYIDLTLVTEWKIAPKNMQFTHILDNSPVHDATTLERIFCSR